MVTRKNILTNIWKVSAKRAVISMLLIPTLGSLFAISTFYLYLHQTKNDVLFTNIAGRQRLLSEQLGAYVHMVYVMNKEDDREPLRELVAIFEQSLVTLDQGGVVRGLVLSPVPEQLQNNINLVKQLWQDIKPKIILIADQPISSPPAIKAHEFIQINISHLRDLSNEVVISFELLSHNRKIQIFRILIAVFSINLIFLFTGVMITKRYLAERKKAADALLASKSYTENIITSMTDALFVVTPDATIETANTAAIVLSGYTEDELTGKPIGMVFGGEKGDDAFTKQVLSMVKGKLQVIYDHDPEDFWTLMKTAYLGTIIVGPDGRIVTINEESESIFGYGQGELIGKMIHELLPAKLRADHERKRVEFMDNPGPRFIDKKRLLKAQRKDGTTFEVEVGLVPLQIDGETHVVSVIRDPARKKMWKFIRHTRFGKLFTEEEVFWNVDRVLVAKNGSKIPILMSGAVMRDDSNKIHGAVLVVKDITKRKQEEEELKQRLEMEKLIIKISTTFIGTNAEQIDDDINQALQQIGTFFNIDRSYVFIFSEDTLTMDNTHEWCAQGIEPQSENLKGLPSDSLPWWMRKLTKLENINIPRVSNLPKEAKAEKEILEAQDIQSLIVIPLVISKSLIGFLGFDSVRQERSWSEEYVLLLTMVGDAISNALERNMITKALIDSEDRFRKLAESAFGGIVVAEKGKILEVSPEFAQMFGYTQSAMIGMTTMDLIHPDYRDLVMAKILSNYEKSYEAVGVNKDGSTFPFEASGTNIAHDGYSTRITAIRDITELKRAEEEKANLEKQLRRSQKLETIGTLAGGIAHDFNNILTPILGYTDMALDSISVSDPLHEDLERVIKGTHRAKELVEQILLFSKQIEKERKPLHVHLIVNEALKLLRPSIPSTVQINQRIDTSCNKIMADASQIHQVIVNLSTNAWQAMEVKGGTLTIELKQVYVDKSMAILHPNLREQDYVCLTVSDTGYGMDESTMEHIFEPFFTTKAVDEGTGMGLSVVHGIVHSHNGDIQVDSKPGEGSTFHVYLPVVITENDKYKKEDTVIKGGHESILLVDDDIEVTRMMKTMLERLGYKVGVFNSSIEALKTLRKDFDKYDLVISDLTMPDVTGLKLAGKLQKICPDLPIIIMTGFGDSITPDIQKRYNIKRVLGKPILKRKLAFTIREILDQ